MRRLTLDEYKAKSWTYPDQKTVKIFQDLDLKKEDVGRVFGPPSFHIDGDGTWWFEITSESSISFYWLGETNGLAIEVSGLNAPAADWVRRAIFPTTLEAMEESIL